MRTPEEIRAYNAEWRKKNPVKCRAYDLKNYHSKQRFTRAGVTPEWYSAQLTEQKGQCAICGITPGVFCVDHNHTTGKIRGLLCQRCNTAIGLLGESIYRLTSAAEYLVKHENGVTL